jgi:CheY-like chemotaxis protein
MPKILLVEDDTNLREIFDMRLKAEGYQTLAASDGEEGLVVAMKERPDLIIADVMMPKLSGFEMLETLFAAPEMSNTKAVMMTALGQPEDRARGEKLGVVKYLVKSQVTLEDFVRVVREVMSPDQSSTGPATPSTSPTNAGTPSTNKESEASMPDDTTPQPMPSQPAGDTGTGSTNPISGTPAEPASDQPTTAQEQSAVQDQINSFVSSAPAGDAPAPTDAATPSADPTAMGSPTMPTGDGMATPTATPDAGGTSSDIPMSAPPTEGMPETPAAPEAPADGGQTPPPAV